MDIDGVEATGCFLASDDICQQILTRYSRSSAQQHRHLCATAAAARSIIKASSLDLTPVSYFAAAVTSLDNANTLDSNALDSLTSFLAIVLPLVGEGEIKSVKAEEAVRILVRTVDECGVKLCTSGVRAAVKSVGILLAKFCSLGDWESVSLGFEWLVRLSMDRRPKVRKSAQDSLVMIFKSFQSSTLFKRASKSIYSLLNDHILAVSKLTSSKTVDGPRTMLPEHLDIIHLLNMMKHYVQYMSPKSRIKLIPRLLKMLNHQFLAVTTHVFDVIKAVLEISGAEVIVPNAEIFFSCLVPYMSTGEKNPVDTVLLVASLSKTALSKLRDCDTKEWARHLPSIIEALAGYLNYDAEVADKISNILGELIDYHFDKKTLLRFESQQQENLLTNNDLEYIAIKSICGKLCNVLIPSCGIPNEHIFSVACCLVRKLGRMSGIFMEHMLYKFGDMMNSTTDPSKTLHLKKFFGCAVSAMGPERLLVFLPLSFSIKDLSYSNVWLMPILEKNVSGSSLRFFLEHIVPLAKSFDKASCKVKNSVIRQDLKAYFRGCWALFPAFCRQPIDTYQSFGDLSKVLIPLIQQDSFFMEKAAIGLQVLIHENKIALDDQGSVESLETKIDKILGAHPVKLNADCVYSTKTARKNIKALALNCKEFLQAFTDAFFQSAPEHQKILKGALQSLASICDVSEAKNLFIASTEKFQLLDDISQDAKCNSDVGSAANDEESMQNSSGVEDKRPLLLDFASCFVEVSDGDLVNLLFSVLKDALQGSSEFCHVEAYEILNGLLKAHSWFCISKFDDVIDLLTKMKSAVNTALLPHHFACLQTLLVVVLKENVDEEGTKTFLILNEFINTLKNSDEEGRKVACDTLGGISCKLRNPSDSSYAGLYQKFIAMISGSLSGSSPRIQSGVVSVISMLVYSDPGLCIATPDVFHSVMKLLHSKSIEIIKAVLGFVKVLVSVLQSEDIQHFLPDILDGILRWSSITYRHIGSKVVVILEIMMRKCGTATVKAATPKKYADYVSEVVSNRRGTKSSSKEAGSTDSKLETEQPDSSLQGTHKRKRNEVPNRSKRSIHEERRGKKPKSRGMVRGRKGSIM